MYTLYHIQYTKVTVFKASIKAKNQSSLSGDNNS